MPTYNPDGTIATGTNTNTAGVTASTDPQWLQDYNRSFAGTAVNEANQPYQPYLDPRIQGLDPLQTQAEGLAQSNLGAWKPGIDYASQTAPSQVQNYMNPYQDQVVNRIAQLGQRNLTENLLPQVNSTFTGAGQFGSTRNQDFTTRALRDTNESIMGQQGQLLNQDYNQATQAFQTDASRAQSAAQTGAQLGAAEVGQLGALGQQYQDLGQKNLDVNYQNFLDQRDYNKNQLGWLNNSIKGLPQTNSQNYQSSYAAPQPPNTMSPLLQAAQAFAGAMPYITKPVQ